MILVIQTSTNQRKKTISGDLYETLLKKQLLEKFKLLNDTHNYIEQLLQKRNSRADLYCLFPYKASMWDSMKSIFKKLQGEPQTYCSVVALPYYIKNADYVILQDDAAAEEFRKWNPKPKEKFLPLGSSKTEKAIAMNQLSKDELILPLFALNRSPFFIDFFFNL